MPISTLKNEPSLFVKIMDRNSIYVTAMEKKMPITLDYRDC